jgi:uncharacterized membrane protein YcaP (DUF421 family)
MLLLVLIGGAAQHAMAGQVRSVTDGLVLVVTLAGWSYVLDRLAFRSRAVRRVLEPDPLPLVRDGAVISENLRRESISEDELLGQLRRHGVAELGRVREAWLEGEGDVSVILCEAVGPDLLRRFGDAAQTLRERMRRAGDPAPFKAALRAQGVKPKAFLRAGG